MFIDVSEEHTASVKKPATSEWQADVLLGLLFGPEDGDSTFL
jgi:hypothetical protein